MKRVRYLIVGAGFAGAATAFHLVRMGAKEVLILERETEVGRNSSGLNAAMATQIGLDEAEATLARRGVEFIQNLPSGWPGSVRFSRVGAMFPVSGEKLKEQETAAAQARAAGLEAEIRSRSWAVERMPLLEAAQFEGVLWSPSDGVMDIQALLHGFLEGSQAGGAKLWMGCQLQDIEARDRGTFTVDTSAGRIETDFLINAAGAWAGEVARMVGASRLLLLPCRRHLFRTGPLSWVKPDWPIVWDLDFSYYFRPEAGGLLLSPCDEEVHPLSLPEVDLAAKALLAEKLRKRVPSLQWLRFMASWACLRTLTPDGRFVIGWDPKMEGFFWAAGLGGHGATCSGAVGEMAARLILGHQNAVDLDVSFRPDRLVHQT